MMRSLRCLVSSIVVVLLLLLSAFGQGSDMAVIPAVEFWMGRTHLFLLDELGMHLRPRLDDQPSHLVYLDSYSIDKYEVTNADYLLFVEATKTKKPFHWIKGAIPSGQEKQPVYNVSWDEASSYCKFVGKRLPTEAEWERAARGGTEEAMYPWGDTLRPRPAGATTGARGGQQQQGPKLAHYGFPNGPTNVGSYPPNAFGLFDMTGNLWEWVADWYGHSYYSVSPDKNPKGPETGLYKVIRGGGWADSDERLLAVHYRNYTNPALRADSVGFRCAR